MDIAILLPFLMVAVGYSVSECWPLQYRMAMVSGYRQYGAIILYGALYIALWAMFIYMALALPCLYREGAACISADDFDVFTKEHIFLIFITGIPSSMLAAYCFNKRCSDEKKEGFIANAIRKHGNELDILMLDSIDSSQPVLFVLDNKKLYLGLVVGNPNPLDDVDHQYIRILPIMSGYQNEEGKIALNTDYESAYRKMLIATRGDLTGAFEPGDFEKVIPRRAIKSANAFDHGFYTKFF